MPGDAPRPATVGADAAAHVGPPAGLRSLHPKALTLWRLSAVGRGALSAAFVAALELLLDLPLPTGFATAAVVVGTLAVAAVYPSARYRAWRYGLRESDLFLRHGVVFRTTSLVPYARIQHVDTRHGPLDRWLGLAAVVVYTAGTRGAIVSVPALGTAEAERMRDRLAALSGVGDAV